MLIFNKQKNKYLRKISAFFILSFFVFIFSFGFTFAQVGEGLTTQGDIVSEAPNPNVVNDENANPNVQTLSPTSAGTNQGNSKLLAPLPGLENYDVDAVGGEGCALSKYFNVLIKLFIGICAVLAMIMIVTGGIMYMTSESISQKGAGLDQAKNAVFGLILALGAYAILNTLNPQLLNLCPNIPKAKITIQPNSINDRPVTGANIARCTPLTSGPCAPSNLGIFGSRAENMSKICNVESGGNTNAVSGTDVGTDGTPFSFGLFQINLLANGSLVQDSNGASCGGLFMRTSDGAPIPPASYIQGGTGNYSYNARLRPGMESRFNDCKNRLMNPTENLRVAGVLFQQGASAFGNSMFAWRGDIPVCASAFQ